MFQSRRGSSGDMDGAQSDLVEGYKLDTEFLQDHVRDTDCMEKAKNIRGEVEEPWRNCGELGRGGSGVVYKQIQETTGNYRAVKKIDKRLPLNKNYAREPLVMAILSKACVQGNLPSLPPLRGLLAVVY